MKNLIKLLLVFYLGFYSCLSFSALTGKEALALKNAALTDSDSLQTLKAAAESGDAEAQNWLGNYFLSKNVGMISERDSKELYKQSFEWKLKAAEQGHRTAQYSTGVAYAYGYGVTKDIAKAISWYQKAANQGSSAAEKELSELAFRADSSNSSSTNSNNQPVSSNNNTVALNEPDDPQVFGASASPNAGKAKVKGKKKK